MIYYKIEFYYMYVIKNNNITYTLKDKRTISKTKNYFPLKMILI